MNEKSLKVASLEPLWILGFVDGEGCFSISFSERKKFTLNLEVRPSFSVSQKSHSRDVLDAIQVYFGCGGVRPSKADGTHKYETRDLDNLFDTIIPFFQTYTLLTQKRKDFETFVTICKLIRANQHRNKEGLIQIIELAVTMNQSGKRKYSREKLLQIVNNA